MLAIVNIAKNTKFASKPVPTFISFDLVFSFIHALPPGIVDSTLLRLKREHEKNLYALNLLLRLTNQFLSYVSFIFFIKIVVK